MNNAKTYLIADFVKILDIPRSTVKDWLERYDSFMEFDIRGRRKFYFKGSLEILREIAELRADGYNASEIMDELSSRYPENAGTDGGKRLPGLSKENPAEKLERMLVEKLQDAAAELHQAQMASLLSIVKRQQEKVERMINMKFQDMAANTHATNMDANKLGKQNSRRLLLVIALGFTIVIAVIVSSSNLYYQLNSQKEELRNTEANLEKTIEKTLEKNNALFLGKTNKLISDGREQQLRLQRLAGKIDSSKVSSRKDIEDLKAKFAMQQKLLNTILESCNNAPYNQEIDAIKKSFAAEREVLLKKMADLLEQSKKNGMAVLDRSDREDELQKTVQDLQDKFAKQKDELERERKRRAQLEAAILELRIRAGRRRVPAAVKE